MNTSKTEILTRIRTALGDRGNTRLQEYTSLARNYRQRGVLDADARLELFLSQIEHYDGGIYRCDRASVRQTIAGALTARARRRIVVPAGFPRESLPEGFEFVTDEDMSYEDLDRSDGALTTCTVAIAMTGTIVLRHAPSEGRRALTLVPGYHLCLVETDQIVETVPEAIRRLQALKPPLVTTISGPSATADIEMTRIKGVHGPPTLDVVLVG